MLLHIVKSHYRVQGSDPEAFTRVQPRVHLNGQGGTQLRLEAIDALGDPLQSTGPRRVPPAPALEFAHAAATTLLQRLGFTDVERDGERVTSSTPEQTEGYILTRFADKYGRAVCPSRMPAQATVRI